jgi:DNA helicase-2/ATP-dependent DNA helicase PcrA
MAAEVTLESLLERLPYGDRQLAAALRAKQDGELELIAAAVQPATTIEPRVPDTLSATSYVAVEKGELTAWDLVRPLPQRPTAARRIGTEVHRLIEERSRGVSPFPEESELDEPSQPSSSSLVADRLQRWEKRYGERTIARLPSGEPMIEVPFTLLVDGRMIRGRIDAVYETDDGGLEIVDFKTGRQFEVSDEADQLALYGRALQALGLVRPGQRLTLTYAFLGVDRDGEEEGSEADGREMEEGAWPSYTD